MRGIGPKIAASVKRFLAVPENLAVLERHCVRRAPVARSRLEPLMRKTAADAGVAAEQLADAQPLAG